MAIELELHNYKAPGKFKEMITWLTDNIGPIYFFDGPCFVGQGYKSYRILNEGKYLNYIRIDDDELAVAFKLLIL
jgi:hypothetical protein